MPWSRRTRNRIAGAAASAALVVVIAVGLSQAPDSEDPGPPPSGRKTASVRDRAPAPLRVLYAKGDRLQHLQGDEFVALIKRLRGYPIVINKWASWCKPCRDEFPMFRRVAAKYGDRVAFIGINAGDSPRRARAFLRDNPTLYPHVKDPEEQISHALRADRVYPSTVFLNRKGDIVTVSSGPFPSEARLERSIREYGLSTRPRRGRG